MIIGLYAGGMTAREIRHHTGGSTIGAGPGAGGRSRRSPTRCAGAVMEWQRRPPGGLLPGDPPRRDPRRWSAPTTGCRGRPNPHRRGRGAWTASSTWLKDLDPGRGGGLLLGPCVRRSGQQGGARGVLIVCCDGPAGLPEAARGDLARLHGPHLRGPPRSAPPVRFVAYGDRKGVAAALRPSLHRPRRGGRPTGPGRLPPVRPGPRAPPDGGGRGRGPGRGSSPSWPSPRPCAGSPLHHQRDRVAQPPSRAVRREPRPLSPPTRRRPELLWPAGLQHPRGRRAAQRAKDEEHARPLAQGQRVDSSTGRVTTNRSAPPAGPPGSPPPTPTESTPISDRTRLHRNIDRLHGGHLVVHADRTVVQSRAPPEPRAHRGPGREPDRAGGSGRHRGRRDRGSSTAAGPSSSARRRKT